MGGLVEVCFKSRADRHSCVHPSIWSIMAEKPAWWGLLILIPIVNLVIMAIVFYEISVRFGRGIGTTIGLFLLPFIFWPILGFGSAEYHKA